MNNYIIESSCNKPQSCEKNVKKHETDLFAFKNLYKAYFGCRENKRTTYHAAKFEMSFESELLKLKEELKSHNYQPGPSICFAITDPKLREVWAADFRDRVVHHLLVGYLESIWEKMFVFHSYACRKGKGAHKSIRYLKKIIAPDLFFLQVDIQSFFVSIDKSVLFSLVKKRVKNPEILWLAERIIFHDPTTNYIPRGDLKLLQSVPPHKSLFGKINCGLPIGNLTSQFFANVYLNELDQFIKHSLKCRYYFRYMDDLLLLNSSKEQLLKWRDDIKTFVETNLKLKLHPKKQILQPATNGINFCGYIVKPDYTLIRRRTVKKLKNNLWHFNEKILNTLSPNDMPRACDIIFNDPFIVFDNGRFTDDFRHIFSSINSVYGFFKHANCYNLRKTLYEKHFGILKMYLRPANRNYHYFIWKEPY
jgi:retron-type reverse transcriptase